MKINFTKKQFETLIKMAYVGNWVVNGVRSGRKGDERVKEYDELEEYIFSFAKDFGLEKYVDDEDGEIYPSVDLEDGEVRELIDYYDDDVFWNELADSLARRDFFREYGAEAISKMSVRERIEKDHPFLEKYWDETREHGIERLEIKKIGEK